MRPPGGRPLAENFAKKNQSIRIKVISRFQIQYLVLGQCLTSLGPIKDQMSANYDIVQICSLIAFNSEQDAVLLLYPVPIFRIYGTRRTASPSLTVTSK